MIKTLIAYTGEVDDAELAIQEITEQLDLASNQKANTVGIVTCHYEYVLSGVAKAVCEALPFDVVGTTTSAQAVREDSGNLLLTLMVLTSDDDTFVTKRTPSLLEAPGKVIAGAYREAAAAEADKPALILVSAPFLAQNSGDEYVNVLTEASGGVPCFGTLAVDDTADFSNCFLLFNGQDYRDQMGLVLIYSNVSPKFYLATISKSKILDNPALVTKSAGHILMEVNNRPVAEYFEDLGLTKASETSYAMTSLPFMMDYGDGTPMVSKVFIGLTPERYAICAGVMPEGATLYLGVFDKDDVLLTTGKATDRILADLNGASGLLIYSCISRTMSLGSDNLAELDLIRGMVGEKLPFMMAYSGGEICPTQVSSDKAINRFHNNAFVACVF